MSATTSTDYSVELEPASRALVAGTAKPPFLYELGPAQARAVLEELQAAPIDKLPVNDSWVTVPTTSARCGCGSSARRTPSGRCL